MLALTCLLTAVLAGCGGLNGDLKDYGQKVAITQVKPADREGPVKVSGESLAGDPVDFSDFLGSVVVVNVWWSGCGPCRSEMPLLSEAAEELDAKFVGINVRDLSTDVALTFERELSITYPSIYDPGSETLLEFGKKYFPRSMPATVILDREGRVAALISGVIPSATTLSELVDEVGAEDG